MSDVSRISILSRDTTLAPYCCATASAPPQPAMVRVAWAKLAASSDAFASVVPAGKSSEICFRLSTASRGSAVSRSEEHTSELQSLMRISYAVFCLKKTTTLYIKRSTHDHMALNIYDVISKHASHHNP